MQQLMWSDEELDAQFSRLNSPDGGEPAPHERVPFPLDSWLTLEKQLEADATKRLVRRRLWQLVGLEALALLIGLLAWQGWRWQQTPNKAPLANISTGNIAATKQPAIGGQTTTAAATPLTTKSATEAQPQPQLAEAAGAAGPAATAGTGGGPSSQEVASHLHSAQPSDLAAAPLHRTKMLGLAIMGDSRTRHLATTRPAAQAAGTARAATQLSIEAAGFGAGYAHNASAAQVHADRRKHFAAGTAATVAARRHSRRVRGVARHSRTDAASAVAGKAFARQNPRLSTAAAFGNPAVNSENEVVANGNSAQAIAALALRPAALAWPSTGLPQSLTPLALADAPAPEPTPTIIGPRLLLTAVAAPDFNTVRFADVQLPQLGYGLTAEYRLTPLLRLRVGLLRTTKNYRARRDDYDWAGAPGAMRYNFGWVEGSCTVLDMPITLRQDWLRRPNHTIFTAVGMSTYWFEREHYSYDSESPSLPFTWQKDLSNENRYFFSVLNLSFGYERRLSARWSWQAEPYLKVPLTGVGFGQVQLLSGGVQVGVKYGLGR